KKDKSEMCVARGWYLGEKKGEDMGVEEDGGIVWDEIGGIFVGLIALPN
ncbi:hypothetical protein HID67_04140, partial [Pasteurella multocida]|nr:hypothetical protein [Pasteurella multocida]